MYDWAEFRHFWYLLKILEKGGFRVAAEELHTSQPNLTVQARRFQDHASVRLFRRLKNGQVVPTETGIAFVTLARLVLEVREEVIDALVAIERGEVGMVRIGSTPLVDPNLFRTFCTLHRELVPQITVRPARGNAAQLAKEVLEGTVDVAMITLPLAHPDLHVEELCRDRIVVCLRKDHPLASKAALQAIDLQDHLTIIYHPQQHPEAHGRLLELLADAGVTLQDYSCASHPSELQILVKEGHGVALIREGTLLDGDLITRPLQGVNWTVDTAIIHHKQHYPKTVPILIRRLKRGIPTDVPKSKVSAVPRVPDRLVKRPVQAVNGAMEEVSRYNQSR
jgi:DNA-binding transcriptional LysR family regulator